MPQRFLRPGIRTSQRWNSVSRDAQALYIAILTLVDDYGRYDGRDSILCADAFTIWNELHPAESCGVERIPALRSELLRAGLVDFYDIDGKKYLQVVQWQERVRENAKEKWPKNPNPLRNPAESCGILPPSSPPSPSPSPTPPTAPAESPSVNGVTVLKQIEDRVNLIYKRTPADHWSYAEQTALVDVAKRDKVIDEFVQICYWRDHMHPDDRRRFFPQSVNSLLTRWTEALDKARVQAPKPTVRPHTHKNSNLKPFTPSPELAKKFREQALK